MQPPNRERIAVTVDLVSARWFPVAVMRRGRRRDHMYRYGTTPQFCYLICLNLRDHELLGQVAEVSLEQDMGGPVITIHRLLKEGEGGPRPPSLSRLIWPEMSREL